MINTKKLLAAIGLISSFVSLMTGMIIWMGGSVMGPGAALQIETRARIAADSALLLAVDFNTRRIAMSDSVSRVRWDSLAVVLRPLRITTCARSTSYERYLMQMNCEAILERARERAQLEKQP